MLDKKTYNVMKKNYGLVGSWAIWSPEGDTPRSNTGDLSWVNDKDLLQIINTNYIFVGLNWSSTHGDQNKGGTIAWANFHSNYSYQTDFKLRFALQGPKFVGSYITDLFKYYPEKESNKVHKYLRDHPQYVLDNIESFKKEIAMLGEKQILVALGKEVYYWLKKYFDKDHSIVYIQHYASPRIGKEAYRKAVTEALKDY